MLGAALAAAYAGALRFEILGAAVSIRSLSRPLVAAGVTLALRLWLARDASFAGAVSALARTMAGALVAAGVIGWFTYNSAALGGADSYGYVSAAERLLEGDLVHVEPLAAILPANGARVATPLGYVPSGRTPNASVPAYPLGLPAVMAAAIAVFGHSAPFFVAPVSGLILLAAGYLTALAWYRDRQAALIASALLALHPLVFTYSIQPMSDVPAAAALTVAIAALSRARSLPVIAGSAAALALMIRPALAPAAVALAALPLVSGGPRRLRTMIRYLVPVTAGAILQGWTQWYLYGDVFASGYGPVTSLFSLETLAINLRSYGYWGLLALGPVWLAAVTIGTAASDRTPRVVLLLLIVSVATPYLFYRPYEHWETLRFLLPALVVATIVAAFGVLYVSCRLAGPAGGALIAVVIAAAVGYGWTSWLETNRVFGLHDHEARHRHVGELVARATPGNAVILALQHSGSVRYYAGRATLNWDQIPSGELAATVVTLRRRGLPVFLLIDSDEERTIFRTRHGRAVEDDGWLPGGQYRNVQLLEARPSTNH